MPAKPASFRKMMMSIILFFSLACTVPAALPGLGNQPSNEAQKTRIALGIQATMLSKGRTATEYAISQLPSATMTQEIATDTPTATSTEETPPTETAEPTYTLAPVETPTKNPDEIMDQIRNANILVYEDSWGSYDMYGYALDKRIDDALDDLGLTGNNVVRVHDALGDFFGYLNSGTKWDLIIIAAENRNYVKGEIWDPVYDLAVNEKTAVIAELWYLDQIAIGHITPFMDACGIGFHQEWYRRYGSDLNGFIVTWLVPDHPIFHQPYELSRQGLLVPSSNYDLGENYGDLLKITGGDAVLLAGTQPKEFTTYGTIAECMQGRVIFQTLSTHHYKYDDMLPLWKNYIVYTLTNHFESQ